MAIVIQEVWQAMAELVIRAERAEADVARLRKELETYGNSKNPDTAEKPKA